MTGAGVRRLLGPLSLLLAACASAPAPALEPTVEVHPEFGALRPVTLQVRVDGDGERARALRWEIYRGLIEKGYSVLAPGAAAGPDVGIFRARFEAGTAAWSGEATLEDSFGTVLYRATATGIPDGLPHLAAAFLQALPPK